MKITIDTNIISADKIVERCMIKGWDVAVVSVTSHELEGTSFDEKLRRIGEIFETGVWDESRWGSFVWGSGEDSQMLNWILSIISNGSFPDDRSQLSEGQKHQLRDAMIIQAHARESRNIFITNDCKGFIDGGRREKFETKLNTRIMTLDEFRSFLEDFSDFN